MLRFRWRRGALLLQTLVMAVILSMMAVMVLKWVLGRYMLSARAYRANKATVHSSDYIQNQFSTWNMNTVAVPSNGSGTLDSQTMNFTTSGPGTIMRTFNVTSDEEQGL
jgi:hypothetical protein